MAQNRSKFTIAKGNQKNLLKAVEKAFEEALSHEGQTCHEYRESTEVGHYRIENRQCWVIPAASISPAWPSTKILVMVKSDRSYWNKVSTETKYYISSLPANIEKIMGAIRVHWSIENQLRWFLDVVFGEDDSRIRKDHGAENFGTLRSLALGLLQKETSLKQSIGLKRYRAAMDNDYLIRVLLS